MAHLCWAPDQTERLWRRRRIDGGRGWWGWRREASGGRGEDGGGGRRRRRYGQQPNKLLINQELPGVLSWVLHARRFDTSSGSHLWFLLVKDGGRAPPLLADAIKGTRFVSPVITLAAVPERGFERMNVWFSGLQTSSTTRNVLFTASRLEQYFSNQIGQEIVFKGIRVVCENNNFCSFITVIWKK